MGRRAWDVFGSSFCGYVPRNAFEECVWIAVGVSLRMPLQSRSLRSDSWPLSGFNLVAGGVGHVLAERLQRSAARQASKKAGGLAISRASSGKAKSEV